MAMAIFWNSPVPVGVIMITTVIALEMQNNQYKVFYEKQYAEWEPKCADPESV